MNTLPVVQQQDGTPEKSINPSIMTTSYFEFFGVKPNYCILFPFGLVGFSCRPCDGNHKGTNFESQCMLRIALGCSKYINGMIFYNPVMDSMSVSFDFIGQNQLIGEGFDCLQYGGELTISVLLDDNIPPPNFNVVDTVFI